MKTFIASIRCIITCIALILILFIKPVMAQMVEPVKWTFKVNHISDNKYELNFIANIDAGWHLYSQTLPKDGPMPTKFIFNDSTGISYIGNTIEPEGLNEFDAMFGMQVKYFQNQAIFTQEVEIDKYQVTRISGIVSYQVCNDNSCAPFDTDFSFQIANSAPEATAEANFIDNVSSSSGANNENNSSLFVFFWLAFAGGLVAIITPCVFPMIPMTVSYFLKAGKKGKIQAIIYGVSIVLIYTLFGTLVSVIFGVEFSNWLSTHWVSNMLFFFIFVIFAASFFGYFEITMPSWLVNKSVSAEDKGGTIGTLFMALTLVLVSFSCTGPIVGSILVESVGGQILKPVIGMAGFSLAFAIPFSLFALFPQWLNKMPKSGSWLNTVKVVLGFIELAFALKFLNVPDQTYHWGILDREVYLAFWIVLFTMLGLYLMGKIRFPHDGEYPVIKSFPRLLTIVATFTFVIYLVPGLWGAPLKGISGWLPPMEGQDFDITTIVRENSASYVSAPESNFLEEPKYSDSKLKLPHGLKGYFDYNQALKVSKASKKPVLIDFTGHGCTNCREMENRVWSDPEVLKRLREKFIIAALYVDDKVIEMPREDWFADKSGKQVKLLGKKNSNIQIEKFGTNAQPFYVIVDETGKALVKPHSYDLDVESYIKFLDEGIAVYNKTNM